MNEENIETKEENEKSNNVSLKKEESVDQQVYQEGQPKLNGMGTGYQNTYGQQPYYVQQQPYQLNNEEEQSYGMAIASFVLGMVSVLLFCSCINIVTAILSIIFGIIHLASKKQKKGMAIAGIICSAISIIMTIVFYILVIQSPAFKDDAFSTSTFSTGADEQSYFYFDENKKDTTF